MPVLQKVKTQVCKKLLTKRNLSKCSAKRKGQKERGKKKGTNIDWFNCAAEGIRTLEKYTISDRLGRTPLDQLGHRSIYFPVNLKIHHVELDIDS